MHGFCMDLPSDNGNEFLPYPMLPQRINQNVAADLFDQILDSEVRLSSDAREQLYEELVTRRYSPYDERMMHHSVHCALRRSGVANVNPDSCLASIHLVKDFVKSIIRIAIRFKVSGGITHGANELITHDSITTTGNDVCTGCKEGGVLYCCDSCDASWHAECVSAPARIPGMYWLVSVDRSSDGL